MSTEYRLYTEAQIEDKWICLNTQLPKLRAEHSFILAETFHSNSRTFFSKTADKLEEIGFPISYHELSEGLQKEYASISDQLDIRIISIDFKKMKSCMPNTVAKEHHGYSCGP